MKKEVFAPWIVQAVIGVFAAGVGSYVALRVMQNNIHWIEQIQQNHELRIESLELRAWRSKTAASGLGKRQLLGHQALALKLGQELPFKLPSLDLPAGPFHALRGHQTASVELPALPGGADHAQIPIQPQAKRKIRHGRDPPAPAPTSRW